MSEEAESKRSDDLVDAERSIAKSVRALVIGAFALGGWVATLELRTQAFVKQAAVDHIKITETELWRAGTESSRYSMRDHNNFAGLIQDQNTAMDKRITRVEDSFAELRRVLDRIESRLVK